MVWFEINLDDGISKIGAWNDMITAGIWIRGILFSTVLGPILDLSQNETGQTTPNLTAIQLEVNTLSS